MGDFRRCRAREGLRTFAIDFSGTPTHAAADNYDWDVMSDKQVDTVDWVAVASLYFRSLDDDRTLNFRFIWSAPLMHVLTMATQGHEGALEYMFIKTANGASYAGDAIRQLARLPGRPERSTVPLHSHEPMQFTVCKFTCAPCSSTYTAPCFGEQGRYGEFLLWSSRGSVRYLNALTDATYEEVDKLLTKLSSLTNLPRLMRASHLRRAFGPAACDWDAGLTPFEIDVYPPCPNCGAQSVTSWQHRMSTSKPQPSPIHIKVCTPPVTHEKWKQLSEDDKLNRLKQVLALS